MLILKNLVANFLVKTFCRGNKRKYLDSHKNSMNTNLEDESELKPPDLVQLGKAILNNKALADEKADITWTSFSISHVCPFTSKIY